MTHPDIALSPPSGPPGAPLLVLGHSIGTGPLIWEDALPALAARFRVSLLTLPGHAGVPVPPEPFSLRELADAVADGVRGLGEGPARYAGVSIGGALALVLALEHPKLFPAVAALAAGAELGGEAHWLERAALVREQSTSVLLIPSASIWFAPDSIANRPELTGRILHALQDTPAEGYARCAEALSSYDLRADLGRIRVPVLAAWGEHDTVGTEARQAEIVAGVRNGRAVRIDGAAHQPPAEQPERTAAALLRFFAELGS